MCKKNTAISWLFISKMTEKTGRYIRIAEWSEQDRPREKLVSQGSRYLSHAELLAILLSSGSRNQSALALAQAILLDFNQDLRELSRGTLGDLMAFHGIGKAKAVTLLAAFELGLRIHNSAHSPKDVVQDSRTAYETIRAKLRNLKHEEFWILYLNNANGIIRLTQLSKGGITGTIVDIRLLLRQALELGAVGLIVAHNHPSDQLKPSRSDIALTQKLAKAATVLDIKLLDHLIITESSYFSFADEKLI